MAKQFTLGKRERLKSRKQIELLFAQGRSFNLPPFRIYYHFSKAADPVPVKPLQMGVGVSHRQFRNAVDRNRVKRLIRENFRTRKTVLEAALLYKKERGLVFFIFTGKELPEFEWIAEKMEKAIQKLAGMIHESNTSNT